jgi:hypothetical protein
MYILLSIYFITPHNALILYYFLGEACEKVRQEARQMVVRGDIDSKQVRQKIGNIHNVVFDLMLAAQWSNFKEEARLDIHCEKNHRTFRCSFTCKEYHPDVE